MNLILEKYLWSSTYWQYLPGMEKDENYEALRRGYPVETTGTLKEYHYDRQKKQLEVSFEGTDTLCYLPFRNVQADLGDKLSLEVVKEFDDASYVFVKAEEKGIYNIRISEKDGE